MFKQDITQMDWIVDGQYMPAPNANYNASISPFGLPDMSTGDWSFMTNKPASSVNMPGTPIGVANGTVAGTGGGLFGSLGNIGDAMHNYFVRAVIIILGLIFVAAGLHMFNQQRPE